MKSSNVDAELKVGVIESLTGDAAYYGTENMRGVDIALEEMSSANLEYKFSVIHEDSVFSPKIGVDAYNKLRNTDIIDAVITHASSVSVAVRPLAANDGILQIAASASASNYSTDNDLSFRISPRPKIETGVLSNFINAHYNHVSIIYMNNEIGLDMAESVRSNIAGSGIEVDVFESFSPSETDFRSSLLKIKEKGSEAIFAAGTASSVVNILKQSKELGLNTQLIGFRGAEDPLLLAEPSLAEGFIYSYAFNPDAPVSNDFTKAYVSKYGNKPTGYAAEGYESFKLIAMAFIYCGKNYPCMQNYLENIKHDSVFGELSFDKKGDVEYGFFMKTVKDGRFTIYEAE